MFTPLAGIWLLGNSLWLEASVSGHTFRLLQCHVQLAGEAKIYAHFSPQEAQIFIKGMLIKNLPLTKASGLQTERPRLARIRSIIPITPPPTVIVKAEEVAIDPAETVSSLGDIMTVHDMPATFALILSDGTHLFVESTEPLGLVNFFRRRKLEIEIFLSLLRSKLEHPSPRWIRAEMSPEDARSLFWSLEEGMGVIY